MLLQQFLTENNYNNIDTLINKFNIYTNYLLEYNQNVNLTAITEKSEIDLKHYIDSLHGEKYFKGNVLDIGAGAGFPSIPLALIKKECNFTLADSLNKRIIFLNSLIEKLELTNVSTIHTRAEDIKKREFYDTVTARAVASLNILLEYTIPFLKVGGKLVAYKGEKAKEEIINSQNALKVLGASITDIKEYNLYKTEEKRTLIIITKNKKTDIKYPRIQNRPRTNPL